MSKPALAAFLSALFALAGCNPGVESGGAAGTSSDGENTTPALGEGPTESGGEEN